MKKSPEAFRTISEVADWLGVPTHVLRFWESRFSQVKPVKRAGGRRYYRPSDMMLIGGIKRLLHDDGMTIRAVQKLLREEGVKHVSGFSQPVDDVPMTDVTPETEPADEFESPIALDVPEEPIDNVVPLQAEPQAALSDGDEPESDTQEEPSFAFLSRRAAPEDRTNRAGDRQADLFSSSRDSAGDAAPRAVAPRIPATPDVPKTDPADDAPDLARGAGAIARMIVSRPTLRVMPETEIRRAIDALRSLRASA